MRIAMMFLVAFLVAAAGLRGTDAAPATPLELPAAAMLLNAAPIAALQEKAITSAWESFELAQACCKTCTKGKACGDSCISRDKTCHKGRGCACDAR